MIQKSILRLPGGLVVKGPSCNARETGLTPGLGGSHTPQGNWVSESQLLKPSHPGSLCSSTSEATAMRSLNTTAQSCPSPPQLERAHVTLKT